MSWPRLSGRGVRDVGLLAASRRRDVSWWGSMTAPPHWSGEAGSWRVKIHVTRSLTSSCLPNRSWSLFACPVVDHSAESNWTNRLLDPVTLERTCAGLGQRYTRAPQTTGERLVPHGDAPSVAFSKLLFLQKAFRVDSDQPLAQLHHTTGRAANRSIYPTSSILPTNSLSWFCRFLRVFHPASCHHGFDFQ